MSHPRTRNYEYLERLFRKGLSCEQISKKTGLAPSTVYAYLGRMESRPLAEGPARRRADRDATICRLAREGKFAYQIAGTVRCSLRLTQHVLQQNGIVAQLPPRKITATFLPKSGIKTMHILADLIKTCESLSEISRKRGVSRQRVSQVAALARNAGITLMSRGGTNP